MESTIMEYEIFSNYLNLILDKEEWEENKDLRLPLDLILKYDLKIDTDTYQFWKELIGEIGVKAFFNIPILQTYSKTEVFENNSHTSNLLLLRHKALTRLFSDALWFVKDNSIYSTDILLLSDSINGGVVLYREGTLNYTKANGEFEEEFYSVEEIKSANEWYKILFDKFSLKVAETNINIANSNQYLIQNNVNKHSQFKNPDRLQRALKFLILARGEGYLPAKLTYYMSILESLLTNSNQEVGMQVRERTAKLLGKDQNECIEIANAIKIAYGIRSSYVHGSIVSKQFKPYESLEVLTIKIDELIREILKLFLKDFYFVIQKDDKDFSKWISDLTYSNIPFMIKE